MRPPDEVLRRLRARFGSDYPDWARGQGAWPLRVALHPPTTAERSADPVACHAWADEWARYQGPGTVEYGTLRFPTGRHRMPRTLSLAGPREVAAAHEDTAERWRTCGRRLVALERAFPRARFDRVIRRITELPEDDHRRLVAAATWLAEHPASGMLLRQLPIEGVDTKWLRGHAALVLALLGNDSDDADDADDGTDSGGREPDGHGDLAPGGGDPGSEAGDLASGGGDPASGTGESGSSRRLRLHRRLGLRVPPDLVQTAVLCPELRTGIGGMRHLAAAIEDLDRWPAWPTTVVILENKETAYAIVDDRPGTVVLCGLGSGVTQYARIGWVRAATRVVYWGDLDLPGLRFVHDLRGHGIDVPTVLMESEVLRRFRHLAVDGTGAPRSALPRLTPVEQELRAELLRHVDETGTGLVLEQERVPWDYAWPRLDAAIRGVPAAPAG